MKKLYKLRYIFTVLLILNCTINSYSYGRNHYKQKTVIQGKVTNFAKAEDLPLIEIVNFFPFLTEYVTNSQFIDDEGGFRFEIEQIYPEDILITFEKTFTIYATPGDSINLIINAAFLADTLKTSQIVEKYIQAISPNQGFQDDYQSFANTFSSKFGTSEEFTFLTNAQKELDYKTYSVFIKNRSNRFYDFFNEFVENNNPSKDFQNWADDWFYVKELVDLLRYAWLHPMYNNYDRNAFKLPQEYYTFLEDDRHNSEKLMNSRVYRQYMHELCMYHDRNLKQSDISSQYKDHFTKGNDAEAYRIQLEYVSSNSNGFQREFLQSKFLSQLIFWKFFEIYEELSVPSPVGKDLFNQILEQEYSDLQEIMDKPVFARDLNLHNSKMLDKDFVFNLLPDKFPNKVIYVDFWAPWCGPCLAEMPHSQKLQEIMKESDVVFVFLASKCSEKSWQGTISQKELSGEHFLLHDNEYSMIADKFNISGIPRYMIIDKEGKVINNNAPRPSDDKLIGVLQELIRQ